MLRGKSTKTKARPKKLVQKFPKQAEGLQVEVLAVDLLLPYAQNARLHSDDQVKQLASSIAEFGFVNPVLVDENNVIIAGHGRVMAARQLELATVPVIRIAHLDESQRAALRLADNKIASNSKWDNELLSTEFSKLKALPGGSHLVALTGFDNRELRSLDSPKSEKGKTAGFGGGVKDEVATFNLTVALKSEDDRTELMDELNQRGYTATAEVE